MLKIALVLGRERQKALSRQGVQKPGNIQRKSGSWIPGVVRIIKDMKFMGRVYSEDPFDDPRKTSCLLFLWSTLSLLGSVVKPHFVHDP